MPISMSVLRVMADGEITFIGDDGSKSHGETVYCKEQHGHSKACAQALLDVPTLPGGRTPRQLIQAYFDSFVEVPGVVALPTVPLVKADAQGKKVTFQMPDQALT